MRLLKSNDLDIDVTGSWGCGTGNKSTERAWSLDSVLLKLAVLAHARNLAPERQEQDNEKTKGSIGCMQNLKLA